MFDKVVAAIALALIGHLEKRMERGSVAVDGDVDAGRLRRAGTRIREWMREQGGVHPRSKPSSGGTVGEGKGVDAD